jgi:hypothetical protein
VADVLDDEQPPTAAASDPVATRIVPRAVAHTFIEVLIIATPPWSMRTVLHDDRRQIKPRNYPPWRESPEKQGRCG